MKIRSRSAAFMFLEDAINHIFRTAPFEPYSAKVMGAESEDAYFILRHAQLQIGKR